MFPPLCRSLAGDLAPPRRRETTGARFAALGRSELVQADREWITRIRWFRLNVAHRFLYDLVGELVSIARALFLDACS